MNSISFVKILLVISIAVFMVCTADAFAAANPQVKRLHRRSSRVEEKGVQTDELCACPRIYWPVCGSNGITYGNECSINCAKKKKAGLKIVNDGPCRPSKEEQIDTEPEPVPEPELFLP